MVIDALQRSIYLLFCEWRGRPPASLASIFTKSYFLVIGLFISLMVGRAIYRALCPPQEKRETLTLRLGHTIFSGTCFLFLLITGLASAVSLAACWAVQANVEAAWVPFYRAMVPHFAASAAFAAIGAAPLPHWERAKRTEDIIRLVILPAMYRAMQRAMPSEELDQSFLAVLPIIDKYVCGPAWDSLIDSAVEDPDRDGTDYLRLVLDVAYSPASAKAAAPYAARFSQAQRRTVDLIKYHVFHYPAMDAPWDPGRP